MQLILSVKVFFKKVCKDKTFNSIVTIVVIDINNIVFIFSSLHLDRYGGTRVSWFCQKYGWLYCRLSGEH